MVVALARDLRHRRGALGAEWKNNPYVAERSSGEPLYSMKNSTVVTTRTTFNSGLAWSRSVIPFLSVEKKRELLLGQGQLGTQGGKHDRKGSLHPAGEHGQAHKAVAHRMGGEAVADEDHQGHGHEHGAE